LRGGQFRRGKGFRAVVSWFADKDGVVVAEMEAAIHAELYAEVEKSYRASGSLAHVNAEVAIIRKGAAMTMRPYPTGDETARR